MKGKLVLRELSRYPIGTFADIIYRNALLYPGSEAFICGSKRVSFSSFNAQVNRIIHGLQGAGVRKGEVKGYLHGDQKYYKYKEKGFSTPTRKVELYSTILEKWGCDPLPKYTEIPESPVSRPDLAEKFPYILNSGLRTPTFFHSANRQMPWLREIRPDPIVEIHPATAEKHGICEGDWVWIESPRGRAKEKAKLNDGIDPAVIVAEHGWWFPEIKDSGHGCDLSNINLLTDNSHESMDSVMGATNLRVLLCKIYRCEDE